MKKLKAPRLVTVAIFTTITIIFWVFLSIYRILTTKPPPNVPPEILAPIEPDLDINTLRTLSNRVFFEKEDVEAFVFPAPTGTAEEYLETTITPSPTPTESPTLP